MQIAALPEPDKNFSLEEYVTSVRNQLMLRAIEIARGNKSEAARLLGITPQAVHKFLKKKENNLNRGLNILNPGLKCHKDKKTIYGHNMLE